MLPADHRLRAGDAIRRTVRTGRRGGSSALVVHLSATDPPARARIGFVVGRSVGGAVVRNRVKRRLRHLVGEQLDRIPPATELVVRALPPAATLSSAELRAELVRCLDRVLMTSVENR